VGSVEALDLFAGPGGWDFAAHVLGLEPLGIEWDEAACATRRAAGLLTLQADIAELDPLDFAPCGLLIGSPPCPTFSRAGLRAGIEDLTLIYEAAEALAGGAPPEVMAWRDDRSALVLEPLRWALALEPRWLAWEQVPDVLPFWEVCAGILRAAGWNVWTGVVEAERYGVAQTRERAILIGDRDRPVHPPPPTHQRYVKGEAQRHEVTLEGEILPWVSMAEALGWDEGDEVGFPRTDDAGGEGYRERDRRPATEPSFTLGEKARSWDRIAYRNGNRGHAAREVGEDPAPTLHFGGRSNKVDWVGDKPAPTIVTTRRSDKGILIGRQLGEGEGRNIGGWGWKPPGDVDAGTSPPTDGLGGAAVRVTLEEAAVLQSFPPDYPFQGSKSKRFEQVGNAVPPLLAHAILSNLLGIVDG